VTCALASCLIGCTSAPEEPLALSQPHLPSIPERQRQLQEALAHSEAAGDLRPYADGWPGDALPLRRGASIVEAIQLGQERAEVAAIMGRQGWSHTHTRREFLAQLREAYTKRSSRKLPQDLREAEEHLPGQGQFVRWAYQGFPSTADWIVVFFACPQGAPESEARVIARGVFRLGCF
jgi:hypothetical protein